MTAAPSPNSLPYSGPAAQFDVAPGLQDAIPLADGESSFWVAEHAAFIKSPAGMDNRNWIGTRPLGSGSFGTAGLWELRDENNVMTEVLSIFPVVSVKSLKNNEANRSQREQEIGCPKMERRSA